MLEVMINYIKWSLLFHVNRENRFMDCSNTHMKFFTISKTQNRLFLITPWEPTFKLNTIVCYLLMIKSNIKIVYDGEFFTINTDII